MNKKQLIRMSVVIIFIAILVAFVLNLLFKIHTNGLFAAEWNAGDALNYVASIFGALGTIVLGCVAYKQNDKIKELENNNYSKLQYFDFGGRNLYRTKDKKSN